MTDDEVQTVARVHATALNECYQTTVDCPRCEGRGYHHGFGEDGHDPDWCLDCGGPGTVSAYTEEQAQAIAARAAITAYQAAVPGLADFIAWSAATDTVERHAAYSRMIDAVRTVHNGARCGADFVECEPERCVV